jgi:hypothetical protein
MHDNLKSKKLRIEEDELSKNSLALHKVNKLSLRKKRW